jgi:hypothetical protein
MYHFGSSSFTFSNVNNDKILEFNMEILLHIFPLELIRNIIIPNRIQVKWPNCLEFWADQFFLRV